MYSTYSSACSSFWILKYSVTRTTKPRYLHLLTSAEQLKKGIPMYPSTDCILKCKNAQSHKWKIAHFKENMSQN